MSSTGFTQSAVTNAEGAFSFPGLNVGTYTVTVKLSGFKTYVSNDVVLTSGRRRERARDARNRRHRGAGHRLVGVRDRPDPVDDDLVDDQHQPDHQAAADEPQRDGLRDVPARRLDARRATATSTINGLPQGMINITLDGVNIQDNTLTIDRRLLRHRQPAPRRDRRGHGDDGGAGRRRAAGRRADQVRRRARAPTRSPAAAIEYYRNDDAEREHLVQQPRRRRQSRSCSRTRPASASAGRL